MASNLGGRELYKYDWRVEVFLKKYTNREEFELTNSKRVVFIPQNDIISAVSKRAATTNLRLLDIHGTTYKFSDIKKNKDFGGKGEGAGTIKEDRALLSLKEQINDAKVNQASSTIKIAIKNKIYDIFDAVSTSGTPKSDFHLIDIDGKEVVWISHKDGKTAKDFQQWGGISQTKEPNVHNDREVQQFIKDLKANYPNGLPPATTLFRKIKSNNLKMLSVYGNKFRNSLGQQNVTILLQGDIKLEKKQSHYELNAYHVHYNGDSITGDFEPVLMAIYKGDRSDAGVKGTRIVISPIGGRKGKEFV
jgi:hypothetical protein